MPSAPHGSARVRVEIGSGMSIELCSVLVRSGNGSKTARNSSALSFMMARCNRRTILFHAEADYHAYLVRI